MPHPKPTPKKAAAVSLRAPVSTAENAGLRPDPASLFTRASVATVALAMIFSSEGSAQTPAVKKPKPASAATDPTVMPEVVVRGQQDASAYRAETVALPKYTEPLLNVPQTITVVPQAVIQEQGATTLRDVLRNVPGISIQAGEGGVPAGDNLSIRGFNARTDLFIDGVRDIGGYSRDSFNFEQVEVVKGPASAYSGRGSTGGSINIETKTPRQNAFYRGEAGVGTDNYKRFTIDLNQPILALWPKPSLSTTSSGKELKPIAPTESEPTVAVRLNAMWTESDIADRDEAGGRRWGVAPSISFGLGTPTVFTFTYMHMDQDNVPDYGIPWVAATNNVLAKYSR